MREDDKLRKLFKNPLTGVEVKHRTYLFQDYEVFFFFFFFLHTTHLPPPTGLFYWKRGSELDMSKDVLFQRRGSGDREVVGSFG